MSRGAVDARTELRAEVATLSGARGLTSTTPAQRVARKQAAAAVFQAVQAIGPKMIRQLQAQGTLARDGARPAGARPLEEANGAARQS